MKQKIKPIINEIDFTVTFSNNNITEIEKVRIKKHSKDKYQLEHLKKDTPPITNIISKFSNGKKQSWHVLAGKEKQRWFDTGKTNDDHVLFSIACAAITYGSIDQMAEDSE